MRQHWIEGVLEQSLYIKARIELELEQCFDVPSLHLALGYAIPEQSTQTLPKGTKVSTKFFDQLGVGRTLLILGEAGSGKTTTLLELARDLVERAEQDVNLPIPVVFNLSSWTKERQKIADWLVQELNNKYQVAKVLSKTWIKEQQLSLLLDGLDEVKAEYRESCVELINQFSQEYGQTEIVVCSRCQDYDALSCHLHFQRAIRIRPLIVEQVIYYLDRAGAKLVGVKTALQTDPALKLLFEKPLMLNIFVLADQGILSTKLQEMKIDWQQRLFTHYIERMFKQHRARPYPQQRTERWLIWLAQRMTENSQTEFLIESLQPYCLPNRLTRWIYAISYRLTFGLGLGAIAGLTFGQNNPRFGLVAVLTSCLISVFIKDGIEPVKPLRWSWGEAIKHWNLVLVSILVFVLITLIEGILSLQVGIGSLIIGFIIFLIAGLSSSGITEPTYPNQGIWQTFKNMILFYLIGVLGVGTLLAVTDGFRLELIGWSLLAGLPFAIPFGGNACIKHIILRLILYTSGFIPWNYACFLNYATDLLFLHKVGGRYIFIHRLLQENFAQVYLD